MNWFRWYTGAVSDPKFQVVARKSRQNVAAVVAVWALILERASESLERGAIDGFDCEGADAILGLEDGAACSIVDALRAKGLLTGDRVAKWSKYSSAGRCLDVSHSKWAALRKAVFERDRYACQYCGAIPEKPHCDHVFPLSRGGVSSMANLVTACPSCNSAKKARTPEEWLQ